MISENTTATRSQHCNICGSDAFLLGPFGRMSFSGLPPRCKDCGSLERHRAMRAFIDLAGGPRLFSGYRLLRFSADHIVNDSWFASAETSIFEGMNSMDVQSIDRSDGEYDVIVCSHVLEHVEDDDSALRELVRILSADGFLLLAVPHTDDGDRTEDWGFADPSRNLHYRGYGNDFHEKLTSTAKNCYVLPIRSADPVTGDWKRFYFVTKSKAWRDRTLGTGLTK